MRYHNTVPSFNSLGMMMSFDSLKVFVIVALKSLQLSTFGPLQIKFLLSALKKKCMSHILQFLCMSHYFKIYILVLNSIYLFIYLFLSMWCGMWDFSSLTRDQTCAPALEA